MPLFYFIPYEFFPKKKPRVLEITGDDVLLYGVLGFVGFAFVLAFIVIPGMIVINQSIPGPLAMPQIDWKQFLPF
jgi:hypothetical protein